MTKAEQKDRSLMAICAAGWTAGLMGSLATATPTPAIVLWSVTLVVAVYGLYSSVKLERQK